ncbi:hypothetical protein AB837_00125 [bacterium AB1]|nr:hypothetical protein AB837_00125 [bacterium AB1]
MLEVEKDQNFFIEKKQLLNKEIKDFINDLIKINKEKCVNLSLTQKEVIKVSMSAYDDESPAFFLTAYNTNLIVAVTPCGKYGKVVEGDENYRSSFEVYSGKYLNYDFYLTLFNHLVLVSDKNKIIIFDEIIVKKVLHTIFLLNKITSLSSMYSNTDETIYDFDLFEVSFFCIEDLITSDNSDIRIRVDDKDI